MRRSGSSRCARISGNKNCELSDEDIQSICDAFLNFEEDRAIEDIPQRGLRLLESHRGATPQDCP